MHDNVFGCAGGGAALLHLAEFVPEFIETLTDAEERLGAEIVRKALVCPARLIANNAGVEGDVIVESLLGKPFETGYNAVRCKLLPLRKDSEQRQYWRRWWMCDSVSNKDSNCNRAGISGKT